MKEKAKEFTACEVAGGITTELALIQEPIYVYTDEERGIEFGAMFAFALGANPEVLLVFESVREKPSFNCEIVRMGGEEMHVVWKSREIWKSDRGAGQPRSRIPNSYVSFPYSDLENGNL